MHWLGEFLLFTNGINLMNPTKNILKIAHNIGFFSCFSMRFDDIIRYYNAYGELPNGIDGSAQFAFFKHYPFDLTYLFLQDNPQAYTYQRVSKTLEETVQYIPYSELDLPRLLPFVYKYMIKECCRLSHDNPSWD